MTTRNDTITVMDQSDRDFLQNMIVHHQAAIDMASAYLSATSPDTRQHRIADLAGGIVETQTSEVADMQGWLAEAGVTFTAPPGVVMNAAGEVRSVTLEQAAQARSRDVQRRGDRPSQRRSGSPSTSTRHAHGGKARVLRAANGDGTLPVIRGYASVVEQPYQMWDAFGPYTEVVSADAFAVTLAANPDVQLNYQHGRVGLPLARSTISQGEGSLNLSVDATGLTVEAVPVTALSTTRDVLALMDAGVLDEMSFAFSITRGQWSPDYTEFRILEVDINRGDVAVVNYGANPATSVGVVRDDPERPAASRSAHRRIDAYTALTRSLRRA